MYNDQHVGTCAPRADRPGAVGSGPSTGVHVGSGSDGAFYGSRDDLIYGNLGQTWI